jgi:hypothetical protein
MGLKLNKYSCCDFYSVDSIGVLCRGKSLGSIGKYKDNFKNIFLVGQHYRSVKLIGEHIEGSNIVKVWGSTFNKPSNGYKKQYVKYNIKDMQTYLDPTLSDRKAYKFKKISKRNDGLLSVFPRPLDFNSRNMRFFDKRKAANKKTGHPTIGLFAVDMAAAYKPKDIHIIGLDFYQADDFVYEKKHMSNESNRGRGPTMIEYFQCLCEEEKDINFHLYTCCKKIKSSGNLKVINV